MLNEDSNGDNSFEIIDRKTGDLSVKSEITDSLSSISSAYSLTSPVSSLVNTSSGGGGNLLSNVAPPSSLPDFTIWPQSNTPTPTAATPTIVPTIPSVTAQPQPIAIAPPLEIKPIPPPSAQFPATQFSAAIPVSKGVPVGQILPPVADEVSHDASLGGGLMGFVKEAFASGGMLQKMAEKAKSSVDSIITTLDPQMSEYIYSGGDTEVTVTSDLEDEVGAVREAFHSVFGKAWVNGIQLNMPPKAAISIGFEDGWKNASEKCEYSFKFRKTPTIAIETILYKENNDWYDLDLLVLKDTERQITVRTFSQPTPIPLDQFLKDIERDSTQYSGGMDVSQKLAIYLKNRPGWPQTESGVTKRETICLAAKTLVRLYKNKLIDVK